ncbi:MAG: O-antigen ligase family protein [Erysipelotrichaceae bacterium]|nr:O-antigen ligase family protein [Erysipelotrichaceae bacterium]
MEKIRSLNDKAWFEEVFLIVLTIISLLAWKFNSTIGMVFISVIAATALIIFNDFKYVIPSVLFFIFSNNAGFKTDELPIPLIICAVILIVVMLIFFIRNKPNFKNIKSVRGIALLSISCVIPIFWHNIIPEGKEVFYFLYFAYLLYLVVYLFFASALNKNSFRMLVLSMGYLGIMLAGECVLSVISLHMQTPDGNIFSYWYYVGWGLCNEAGIIMCVALPFVFIPLVRTTEVSKILISLFKFAIIGVGMVLTGSRGTLLFGILEILLLGIWSFIFSKKKMVLGMSFLGLTIAGVLLLIIAFNVKELVNDFSSEFSNFFYDNGRFEIWQWGLDVWRKDFVSMTFGMGQVAEIRFIGTFNGYEDANVVYHSTIFHCMATMGNLGLGFLVMHFIDKYKQISKLSKDIMGLMLIGYIMVDLYGMIDNTYGMYYYMIPLMIIMGTLERVNKEDTIDLF